MLHPERQTFQIGVTSPFHSLNKAYSMATNFPVILSFIGAIGSFVFGLRLRRRKVSEKLPATRAGLSLDERPRKIRIGSWMFFGLSWFWLVAASFFAWLGTSNRHPLQCPD
jgi:hypothetical protein